jgi:hypothetical protein
LCEHKHALFSLQPPAAALPAAVAAHIIPSHPISSSLPPFSPPSSFVSHLLSPFQSLPPSRCYALRAGFVCRVLFPPLLSQSPSSSLFNFLVFPSQLIEKRQQFSTTPPARFPFRICSGSISLERTVRMGRDSAHLSASATQIYPSSSHSHSHSNSPSHPPSLSPPRSSAAHSRSELQLNPVSPSSSGHSSKQPRWIRALDVARLALTVLIIGAAAAAVGCEAHALSVYNASRLYDGWALPGLWPLDFDLRPTQGMIVGGAIVLLMGLTYVGLGVVPLVSNNCARSCGVSGRRLTWRCCFTAPTFQTAGSPSLDFPCARWTRWCCFRDCVHNVCQHAAGL